MVGYTSRSNEADMNAEVRNNKTWTDCPAALAIHDHVAQGGRKGQSGPVRPNARPIDPSHIDEKVQGLDHGHLPQRTRTDPHRTSRGVHRTSGLLHSPPPQRARHWSTRHL